MRILDLKNQYVGTALTEGDMGGTNRGRALAFFDENHMAVAVDQGDELRAAVYGFTRNREAPEGDERNYKMWGNRLALVNFKACNTVTFHPVDGDMYFNSWDKGQFFKVEKQQIQEIFDVHVQLLLIKKYFFKWIMDGNIISVYIRQGIMLILCLLTNTIFSAQIMIGQVNDLSLPSL